MREGKNTLQREDLHSAGLFSIPTAPDFVPLLRDSAGQVAYSYRMASIG